MIYGRAKDGSTSKRRMGRTGESCARLQKGQEDTSMRSEARPIRPSALYLVCLEDADSSAEMPHNSPGAAVPDAVRVVSSSSIPQT